MLQVVRLVGSSSEIVPNIWHRIFKRERERETSVISKPAKFDGKRQNYRRIAAELGGTHSALPPLNSKLVQQTGRLAM